MAFLQQVDQSAQEFPTKVAEKCKKLVQRKCDYSFLLTIPLIGDVSRSTYTVEKKHVRN